MAERPLPKLPAHVRPCEIGTPAKPAKLAVRCPKELTHILQRTAAVWEPGSPWLSRDRGSGQ